MSTLQGDLEQNSSIDKNPLVGVQRPSPTDPSSAFGEQLSDTEQSSPLTPHNDEADEQERVWTEDLCHAICVNSWNDVKVIIDQKPNALTTKITVDGQTALHVAAMFGHVTIVEELLKLLPLESLTTRDCNGRTALLLASMRSGNIQVAKCLMDKNNNSRHILGIPSFRNNRHIPVTVAFLKGHQELGRYLYSATPLEYLTGIRGSFLLNMCIQAQYLDIALDLLQQCPYLILVQPGDLMWMPIEHIATLNTAMLGPNDLTFWKRWIYNYISIPSTTAINQVCVDIQQDRNQEDQGQGLLQRLITSTDKFLGIKEIHKLKVLHAQADAILGIVCNNARKAYQENVIQDALRIAAEKGNVEFVFQVSKAVPEIFLRVGRVHLFEEALDHRQARVFNLFYGFRFKNSLITLIHDNDGNTLLHRAAIKAADHVLHRIYAPTLQMQSELQWFKEVENLTPPSYRTHVNNEGMTPEELFRESHRDLMRQGEKWIKATSSSCSVVGTLIATMMFAVAFTVPGGNDQILGYPLFIKQPFFHVFIFSTVLSLLSSSTAVLMFLAILTSQYSEEKFLKSLPRKLILGLLLLFISIASMMIAFLSTIHLMLKHTSYSWGLLPMIILASVPIFLFVLSQFPLLVQTYVSTYGTIFDRKVQPWP